VSAKSRAIEAEERAEREASERSLRATLDAATKLQPLPEGYQWGDAVESGLSAPQPDPAERGRGRTPLTAPRWVPQRPWWPRRR
jgi:hypothetical protein